MYMEVAYVLLEGWKSTFLYKRGFSTSMLVNQSVVRFIVLTFKESMAPRSIVLSGLKQLPAMEKSIDSSKSHVNQQANSVAPALRQVKPRC